LTRITADLSIGSFDVGLEYTLICSFDKTEAKVGVLGSLDTDLGLAQMDEIRINSRKKMANQSLKVTNKRYLKTSSTNIIKKNLKFENSKNNNLNFLYHNINAIYNVTRCKSFSCFDKTPKNEGDVN
jgi:hypothetical protein